MNASSKGKGTRRLEGWLGRYLDHLAVERGLSPNTIAAYRRDLVILCDHLGPRRPIERTRRADLIDLLRRMRVEERAARSVARWIVAVRGFFSYLEAEGVLDDNPAAHLDAPRTWRSLPAPLTYDEVEALMDAPDRESTTGKRDAALLEVLYST